MRFLHAPRPPLSSSSLSHVLSLRARVKQIYKADGDKVACVGGRHAPLPAIVARHHPLCPAAEPAEMGRWLRFWHAALRKGVDVDVYVHESWWPNNSAAHRWLDRRGLMTRLLRLISSSFIDTGSPLLRPSAVESRIRAVQPLQPS